MDLPASVVIGALAVGAAVPLLIYGLAASRADGDSAVRRNLRGETYLVDERQRLLQQSAMDRAVRPAIRSMARRVRRLTPAGMVDALDRRLRLAGSPPAWPLERVLAAKLLFGVTGLILAIVYLANGINGLSMSLALVAGGGGYFVPDAILWGRAQERQALVALALPDTMDQMTISVEAGLGFDAALQRVATNTRGPLAQELGRVLHEVNLGVGRRQAMQNLVERTNVPELRHFVYAIRQAEEFGLPVANVLRIQAGELRVKRRQRAEERAMRMPVVIIFPLFLCIFPALFIVLLGPAFMRIVEIL